jgi:geranylgeranyl pyrophosphate synthase
MSFIENKDAIRAIHKKTVNVIMSCTSLQHIEVAENYVDIALDRLRSFKMANAKEREVMRNIISNITFLLRIKERLLRKSGK